MAGKKMFSTVAHTSITADEAAADAETSGRRDAETSGRRDAETSGRRDAETSGRLAYTWRMSHDDADTLDTLVRELRRQTGRRQLDKASVLLALVQLGSTRDDVREALAQALRGKA